MKRDLRLNHSMDIQRVRQYGKSFAHPLFVLIYLKGEPGSGVFVGVIGTKSVGGAVERNRAKRLLRSASDELYSNIAPDTQLLLIARKRILDSDGTEVRDVLVQQLKRASLYTQALTE